jgi:hypothetical protein
MTKPIQIIACSVFKDALLYLSDRMQDCPFCFTYLPSYLHLTPNVLKERLSTSIQQIKATGDRLGCLYGDCYANIDNHLGPIGVIRMPYVHCYEIFIGKKRYQQIISDQPGTFFIEKEFLLDFENLCRIPMELDDPEMRRLFFHHYQQIIYIRQPLDPDLSDKANDVANLLELKLNIIDADYTELNGFLVKLCRHTNKRIESI